MSVVFINVIAVIYYIITAILTFFSAFAVYILLRFGKNRILSLIISIVYCLFFLEILAQSYKTLQSLF